MPKLPESSQSIQGIDATPATSIYDRLTKAELIEKTREFICRVENFVYLCIGKNDIRGYCYYSEVPANIPCMSFLPKIGGLASFYTYIN